MDIIDDKYCDTELTKNGTIEFMHKPEVICVALNQSYNIRVYLKSDSGDYEHVPSGDDRYQNLISVENMWYIVGMIIINSLHTQWSKQGKPYTPQWS